MLNAKPMSRQEADAREAQLFGLRFFVVLLCALALGAGIGWLLLI